MKTRGFVLRDSYKSEDFHAELASYVHELTGFRIVRALTDDPEYFFSFVFNTPPENSSGVQHIMEHCVLCGSRDFSSKDPFMEAVTASSCSFINAMTYPTYTQYPAAGMILHDLDGIFRMYADAVFRPLLRRGAFLQEGVRYRRDETGKITGCDGVVFNEMSESMGSRKGAVANGIRKIIHRGRPNRHDSGGNPDEIPFLTYDGFKKYHEENYVFRNCTLVLYGREDIDRFADFIEEKHLRDAKRQAISVHPVSKTLPLGKYSVETVGFDPKDNALPSFFLIFDTGVSVGDQVKFRSLSVLVHALLYDTRNPLYKRLVASGIAGDISDDTGLDYEDGRVYLLIGLDDVTADGDISGKCEAAILDSIRGVLEEGIGEGYIRNALKAVEISALDRTSRDPLGIRLVEKMMLGQGSFGLVDFAGDVRKAGEIFERDPKHFDRLFGEITSVPNGRKGFLAVPSDKYAESRRRKVAAILKKLNASKTAGELDRDEREFSEFSSEKPDAEGKGFSFAGYDETLKFMIPDRTVRYSFEEGKFADGIGNGFVFGEENRSGTYIFRKWNGMGVAYVNMAFDISDFSAGEIENLCIVSEAIERADMPGDEGFFRKMYLYVHDFSCFPGVVENFSGKTGIFLQVSFKTLERDVPRALRYLSEFLNGMKVTPETVGKALSAVRADFNSNSSLYAMTFANLLAEAAFFKAPEIFNDVRGAGFKAHLEKIGEADAAFANAAIETVGRIFRRNRLVFSITASESHEESVLKFFESLSVCDREYKSSDGLVLPDRRRFDGDIAVHYLPGDVSYSSLCFCSAAKSSAADIFCDFFQNTSLYEKVRVKGGSYGALASYSYFSGKWVLSSYRDPLYRETFDNFRAALDDATFGETDIKKMKDSFFAPFARPVITSSAAMQSLTRYLMGFTQKMRDERLDAAAKVTLEDVRECAKALKRDFGRNSKASVTPFAEGVCGKP